MSGTLFVRDPDRARVAVPEATGAVLEPPGLSGRNYGRQTAFVAAVAHVAYGVLLGVPLNP